MKKNFDFELINFLGAQLKDAEGKALIGYNVAVNALVVPNDERPISGEEHMKRHVLAEKIYKEKELEVTPEEITFLKSRIALGYSTVVVGVMFKFLDA